MPLANSWTWVNFWSYREMGGDEYSVAFDIDKAESSYLFWKLHNKFYYSAGPSYHWFNGYQADEGIPTVEVPVGQWIHFKVYVDRINKCMIFWINGNTVFDTRNIPGFEFTNIVSTNHYMKMLTLYTEDTCHDATMYTWNDEVRIWSGYHE